MQIVKFIVACMPLAVLASPIEQNGAELVDREASPDGWVEVAPFTEKRDEPKELFRRKSMNAPLRQTLHQVVADTLTPARQHRLQYRRRRYHCQLPLMRQHQLRDRH